MTKSHARFTDVPFYSSIARQYLKNAIEIKPTVEAFDTKIAKESSQIDKSYLQHQAIEHETNLSEKSIIATVFAAMAIEAYIYDYAARELGDNFIKKHLDKLDLLSKYVVITQMTTGKKFPKDKKVYYYIKKLISFRNSAVHSKSKNVFPFRQEKIAEHENSHWNLFQNAKDAIKTLDSIIEYFSQVDPEETKIIELNLKGRI